jgi:hypothetical protein
MKGLRNNETSENKKRKHVWKSQTIDKALLVLFKNMRSMTTPTTFSILLQKAYDFHEKLKV